MEERQKEVKLKTDCKAKVSKNKRLAKVRELMESSDDEDESKVKDVALYLIEIDARQRYIILIIVKVFTEKAFQPPESMPTVSKRVKKISLYLKGSRSKN
jgi:hypothetical protein